MKPIVLIVIVVMAPIAALIPSVEAELIFFTEMPPESHHIPELLDANSTGSQPYMAGWHDSGGSHLGVNQTRVRVSFPDTDPSVIQEDNWLAGGMFVTGFDTAKQQIDYAYYTMVTLHSDGNLYFDFGVFQTYEAFFGPNGTTPWIILLYGSSWWISGASPSDLFILTARWDAPSGMVYWSCQVSYSSTVFTKSFNITQSIYASTIQRSFTVGTHHMNLQEKLLCHWAFPYYMVYYFQFGVLSKYNIGQGGWNVMISFPKYYTNEWSDVDQARSIGGTKALLDLRWLWGGENYEGVSADYHQKHDPPTLGRNRIKFYYSGSTLGGHTLLWDPPPPPGGGGGCPFVYIWNGTQYAIDNNVLGDSEASGGADVEDHYRLEQPLAVRDGKYSLLIREFEQEHSYLDQTRFLAVDHESDVNVAVSPSGEILTYKDPNAPVSVTDNYGNSQLDLLGAVDGEYYEGQPGDYLILDFGNLDVGDAAKLVLRTDILIKPGKDCIHIQTLNETGSWEDVAAVRTRVYWATEIVNLSGYLPDANGELKVRLYFTGVHKIDCVGLDTTKQDDFTVHYGNFVSAIHSEQGSVKTELSESDEVYAELVPGEQIELTFTLPENSKDARTYIIYVKGHYYTIS